MNNIEDKKKSKPLKSSKMGKPSNGSKMAGKSNGYGKGYKDSTELDITDAKNTKPLSSEQAMEKMASGSAGMRAGQAPPARQGQQSNAKPLDPSVWEQAGQAEFSRALGKPAPREAFGGPTSNEKNSGKSNFGVKGKKVV